MEVKFSIIVPVYNVELYLSECLDSIINQTYQNIEIIIVNDGSTDCSSTIINEYMLKDERIVVISQKNSGLSVARNVGLEKATGDYVMFIDSDDYISLDVCQSAVDLMKNNYSLDIIQFARYLVDGQKQMKQTICWEDINTYTGLIFLEKSIVKDCFFASCCNKIFRMDLLEKHKIKFPKGIYYEDLYFVFQSIIYCREVGLLPNTYYFYRKTWGSITNTIKERDKEVLKTVSMLENILENMNPLLKETFWFKKMIFSWVSNAVCFKYPFRYPLSRRAHKIVKSILCDFTFASYVEYFAYERGVPLKYKIPAWLSLHIYPLYVLVIYCFFYMKKILK